MNSTEEQILSLFRSQAQQALQAFDFNQDGRIDRNELNKVLTQAGFTYYSAGTMVQNIFAALDADKSAYISIEDFHNTVGTSADPPPAQGFSQLEYQMIALFRDEFSQTVQDYDSNHDGKVDQDELTQILRQTGLLAKSAKKAAKNLFSVLDKNNDGYISTQDEQG